MGIYRSEQGRDAIRGWCRDRLAAWGHPHETREVSTVLGVTHVVTAGEGPDLAMVPGTNFAAATWLDLVEGLAAAHTVHAVDLPGQPGLSDGERPRGAVRRHGAWLAGVVDALGLQRPAVVAHSLGAVAALRAPAAGARLGRLVLLDPAGLVRLRVGWDVMRPTIPWLRHPDAVTSDALLRMMMAPGHRPSADLVEWMALVGTHVRTSLAPSPVAVAELGSVGDLPIEVLCGQHDAFLPPSRLARGMTRRLPGRGVDAVDGAGHLLPHERPELVADRVADAHEGD